MEYRWLKSFVVLASYLNFSRAAAALYITQPALSKQISALEAAVGVPLLHRDKRTVRLTEAGRAFLPKAEDLLRRTEEATAAAKRAEGGEQKSGGVLRIAYDNMLPFSFFSGPISKGVRAFRQKYPLTALDFCYESLRHMEASIKNGQVDVAITLVPRVRLNDPKFQAWRYITLKSDRWALAVPKHCQGLDLSEEVNREALNRLAFFIQRDDPAYLAERLNVLAAVGLEPNVQVCGSWQEFVMRTEMGEGFYVLPYKQTLHNAVPEIGVISLEKAGEAATIDMIAFWSAENENRALAAFIRQLQ